MLILENLRFRLSSRKQEAVFLKNLHSGERFLKRCVFFDRFHRIRVDGKPDRRKN